MRRQRIIINKKKKKGSPILCLFLIVFCTVVLLGFYVNIVVVKDLSQDGSTSSKTSESKKNISSFTKTSSHDKKSEEIKVRKGEDDYKVATTAVKKEHMFEKINHTIEGAKLKVLNKPGHLQHNILQAGYESKKQYITDNVWQDILNKGAEIMEKNHYSKHLVSIEVGAHRPKQSLDAAKMNFHTYCVEPSPKSFQKIHTSTAFKVHKEPKLGPYIHLLNMAAASKTGEMLEFKSEGSTGDHVGNFDMWNMKANDNTNESVVVASGNMVQVSSLRLDDLIYNRVDMIKELNHNGLESGSNPPPIDEVHAIKIDTQGFEPAVFSGLEESIKDNKIKYILFEYWPNGMALLNNRSDKCEFATQILTKLVSAGYTLYALPVLFHPSIRLKEVHYGVTRWFERPFDDYKADCEYLLDMEKKFDLKDYKAGFWTDYLAVSPDSEPIVPTTFGYV